MQRVCYRARFPRSEPKASGEDHEFPRSELKASGEDQKSGLPSSGA